MSSVSNAESAFKSIPQPGPSTKVIPPPAQKNNGRPRSKHQIAMHQIRLDTVAAYNRQKSGEITHEEFMHIAHNCLDRKKAQQAKWRVMCERVRGGDVSLEEFSREVGYDDEDWEKVRPRLEKRAEAVVANTNMSQLSHSVHQLGDLALPGRRSDLDELKKGSVPMGSLVLPGSASPDGGRRKTLILAAIQHEGSYATRSSAAISPLELLTNRLVLASNMARLHPYKATVGSLSDLASHDAGPSRAPGPSTEPAGGYSTSNVHSVQGHLHFCPTAPGPSSLPQYGQPTASSSATTLSISARDRLAGSDYAALHSRAQKAAEAILSPKARQQMAEDERKRKMAVKAQNKRNRDVDDRVALNSVLPEDRRALSNPPGQVEVIRKDETNRAVCVILSTRNEGPQRKEVVATDLLACLRNEKHRLMDQIAILNTVDSDDMSE
ncbi:hypothetical protein DENSPDRAFT_851847 [Dentipellis sp. KUC8613]|nr:hypothetical protein DENSPDRAFT_851847 [Dentipellis sp. KUC8613]